MKSFLLAVHGGAGVIPSRDAKPHLDRLCREALEAALRAGYEVLRRSGSSVDAVEQSVITLEDSGLFNAGRGSVTTSSQSIEMDAAVMDGRKRRAGAVAGLTTIRNPVSAARLVLEYSEHVLLIGSGAESFARRVGAGMEELRCVSRDCSERDETLERDGFQNASPHDGGTVGAVSRDMEGHLAAATSTGGISGKLPGRVGDSPIIGAGTWADDSTCAVSATGHGESFIRSVFSHEVDALMRYAGLSLHAACGRVLLQVQALGGTGGCIAVDRDGRLTLPFNTQGMYRGWIGTDGNPHTAIYGDDIFFGTPEIHRGQQWLKE